MYCSGATAGVDRGMVRDNAASQPLQSGPEPSTRSRRIPALACRRSRSRGPPWVAPRSVNGRMKVPCSGSFGWFPYMTLRSERRSTIQCARARNNPCAGRPHPRNRSGRAGGRHARHRCWPVPRSAVPCDQHRYGLPGMPSQTDPGLIGRPVSGTPTPGHGVDRPSERGSVTSGLRPPAGPACRSSRGLRFVGGLLRPRTTAAFP